MGRLRHCVFFLTAACGRLGFEGTAPGGGDDTQPDAGIKTTAKITINRTGNTGTIVGSNTFSCATDTCTLEVPLDTPIWLRGLAPAGAWFAGWTGMCGGNFECDFTATDDVTITADFTAQPNRVFITSTATNGAIGGIAGADAVCNARAMVAGLPQDFRAYMSDDTTDAPTRFNTSRGWVRLDGAPFADAPDAFMLQKIIYPPRFDEFGNDIGHVELYTGTDEGSAIANCANWTSSLPTDNGGMTRSDFSAVSMNGWSDSCDSGKHLLCMEHGVSVPIAIHRDETSRVAFISRPKFTPGSGRAPADAICTSDAMNAGLQGSFLAAMATTTESIASRFEAGHIYRRVDGVRLLNKPGLFDTDYLDVPVELDPVGGRIDDDYWTGTLRWNTVTDVGRNCNNWADGSNTTNADMHETAYTDLRSSAKREPCDTQIPVLCLQE